ncbi:MAG TPA: glycosyltransferase family 1 protein, partial [Anaerolineae bacterium]
KEKYHLPDHFLLWVGGISPLKNISNLLRAYAMVAGEIPHPLVMAGFLRWKFTGDLQLIDTLGLKDRVIFTNYVPPEDIPALYNLADIFVFPSIYEGFGLPILEAMACGCPVITSTTGYAPEVAGNAGLLVNPYRPEEIAAAMRTVLGNDTLRQKMIRDGLLWVKHFNWEKTARETLSLFESMIDTTKAHATPAHQHQNVINPEGD